MWTARVVPDANTGLQSRKLYALQNSIPKPRELAIHSISITFERLKQEEGEKRKKKQTPKDRLSSVNTVSSVGGNDA